MTEQTRGEETDRIAEEIRSLIDAAARRGETYLRGLGGDGSEEQRAVCERCPVCAVLAVLRGERSELTTRLAEQFADLLTSVREILAREHTHHCEPDAQPPEDKVQRIDIERVNGSVFGARSGERGC